MVPARPQTLVTMLSPRRHRDPELTREIAGRLYGGTARRRPDVAVEALLRGSTKPTARGYLCQLLAIATWTSLPILPWIRQPALVLAGNDDPIIPTAHGPILAGGLADGRLHRYEGGHLALLTEAPVLVPIIEQFLDQPVPPAAAGTPSAADRMLGPDREVG